MKNTRHARRLASLAALLAAAASASAFAAGYEAPSGTFGVGTYYSSISPTATGNTLRLALHTLTSTGFTGVSYGDARQDLPIVWTDPTNSLNMIEIYDHTSIVKPTGGSIPGWEYSNNVLVWNREHIWPQSWLGVSVDNSYTGPASDLFELAPADPSSNGGRGNDGYGNVTTTGAPGVNGSYFFPGDTDKGDAARSIFYMATRYYTGCTTLSIQNLQLVNGSSYSTFQMGDLQSLLHYNYEDGIDNFERQRNQAVQSLQGDRNPFIDHPEYVWAIFGNTTNSSQISVATPASNGSSTSNVTLPRVMVGGTLGTSNVTVTKTGATPTTFDITATGNATTILGGNTTLGIGTGQPFDYGNVTKTMTVSLNASTSTAGLKSGVITIHNTDLTTAGTGMGSADGNDTVNISAAVLGKRVVTPAQTSFAFGSVIVGATVSSNYTLSTTGDDNTATRVNVAGAASADSNGIAITGTTALFNSATVTSNRTIGGTFTTVGDKSGNLSLAVTTAENSGAGLTGEGVYSALAASYTAKVLAHSNASFDSATDVNSLTLDFGLHAQNVGTFSLPFSLSNLVTTANFTAGLALNSVTVTGTSSAFTSSLAAFTNQAAGTTGNYTATIDTTTGGTYDATYTLNVSDQALPGATTNTALTLHLIGTVASTQTVATLTGSSPLTLNAETLIVQNGGSYSGPITDGKYPGTLSPSAGTLTLSSAASSVSTVSGTGNISVATGASLTTSLVQLNSLHIDGFVQIRPSSTTSTLSSLTLAGSPGNWTGALDLMSNKLVVEDSTTHADTLSTLKSEVAYGQTHTTGIFNSTVDANHRLVVIDNAIAGKTTLGTDTSLDSGSILLTTALLGDTDLNGVVDLLDLQAVANHWQQPVSDWSQGDFDGNGIIDLLDLQVIANHWQNNDNPGGGGSGSSSQASSVFPLFSSLISTPEPTTLALLLPALLLRRRRVRI